jgi:hypothetical protein
LHYICEDLPLISCWSYRVQILYIGCYGNMLPKTIRSCSLSSLPMGLGAMWWQNNMAPDDPCPLSTLMRTGDPNGGNHRTARQGLSSWMLKKSANLSIARRARLANPDSDCLASPASLARLSCRVLFRSPRRAGE